MIDRETAERIKEAADIVEVVGDYVQLIRRGNNYMGLCPFHNERTPSFSVNKRKNFCYCFSCHKGGSPVNFLMEKAGVSYQEALRMLAAKYGIPIKERELTDQEKAAQSERESLMAVNRWASERMAHYLLETEEGRNVGLAYFRERGVTDEAIKEFKLGYSPENAQTLFNDAKRDGFDPERLHTLGLLGKNKEGTRMYDKYHGRVIFPIFNISGLIIGFGGRDIKGTSPAKYINSPESQVYKKSNELYGLSQARGEIRQLDHCFLVEGYMDVIGMWQSGMKNVISSSGTALTEGQIALVHRLTRNITLLYDGDNAGIKAALRGTDMLLAQGMNVKVMLLPDGHDPDSFARTRSPEEFRDYVENHQTDFIGFKTDVLTKTGGAENPDRRAAAIKSILESIACIPDDIERMVYVESCAKRLGVDPSSIVGTVDRMYREKAREQALKNRRGRQDNTVVPSADTSTPDSTAHQIPVPVTPPPVMPKFRSWLNPDSVKPLERQVLKYAVRYGMADFCGSFDDAGQPVTINMVEYLADELPNLNLQFTIPEYAKVFARLVNMVPDYRREQTKVLAQIDADEKETRKEMYDRVVEQGLDSRAIRHEEELLDQQLADLRFRRANDFAYSFAGTRLASDEDDDVRQVATELLLQHHQISDLYRRRGSLHDENEKLSDLVPRALNEWQNALLEHRIAILKQEFASACDADDTERQTDLMNQISELLASRSSLASAIGDRIISV